jgi:hypothetical protein
MSNLLQQSRPEAKVRDVAVAVHAAGVQFGAPRPGMRRRDGNQDREGRQVFAVEVR